MLTLPCNHRITPVSLSNCGLSLIVDSDTQSANVQLKSQLESQSISCPTCDMRIQGVVTSKVFYPAVNFAPISFNEDTLKFKRVTLNNLVMGGTIGDDKGESYRRLAELSNDSVALKSSFGWWKGSAIYMLPTWMKANAFIEGMQKRQGWTWIITNGADRTVGFFNLRKIDPNQFDLNDELASKRIYNVGVLLHSDFQHKGVTKAIGNAFFQQISKLNLDIDAFWIATLVENGPVNHLAEVFGFQHLKTMDVSYEKMILGIWSGTLTQKLWVKHIV